MGDGTPISPSSFFVMAEPPSALDQMRVVLDESNLDQRVSTPDELKAMAAHLSFENGMLAISRLASHAWHIRGDIKAQLQLAQIVFGEPKLAPAIAQLANSIPELEIFPEQHAAILQRLLVLYGREAALGESQEGEQIIFDRAWLAAAVPAGELDRDTPESPGGRKRWIAYLIQNGAYNRTEESLAAMIRPQILLRDIATSESAKRHPHFCPIDKWHRDEFGLSLAEQFAVGIAIASSADVFDDERPVEERSLIGGAYLADIAAKLDCEPEALLELVSADRNWYKREFEKRPDTLPNMAWDRIPFEVRPFLRLSNGELLAISPRAVEAWLGDGFYHRSLSAARQKGQAERFLSFYGYLIEEHVLRILRHAHPKRGALDTCRVHGEQKYGRGGGKLSPDVVVDCGPDLVLIEVCGGRFTLRTIVEGDADVALTELGRLVFDKAEQLDARITELQNLEWQIPDREIERVERIWPVVVSADVLQNGFLWNEIRERLPRVFNQPKVQHLTLLDVSDVEQLAALVEQGHGLVDLLRKKASSPYAELDFNRFVFDTPSLSHEVRSSLLDQRWMAEVDSAAEAFGFDPNSAEALEAKENMETSTGG
jgi:sirohydrochlorin ferrochelatase